MALPPLLGALRRGCGGWEGDTQRSVTEEVGTEGETMSDCKTLGLGDRDRVGGWSTSDLGSLP